MRFLLSIRSFCTQEDGVTAVEYCVMLALVLLTMLIGITAVGSGVSDWWNNINSELDTNGF